MTSPSPELPKSKGILRRQAGEQKYTLTRHLPSEETAYFIQHYWIVRWDLRGEPPFAQTVIAHPNVNLVFEPGASAIYGIAHTTSTHLLQGQGSVVGVKFKPGGFQPFWRSTVAGITGLVVPVETVFGEPSKQLEKTLFSVHEGDDAAVRRVDDFFLNCLPERDPNIALVSSLVYQIRDDRSILRVDDVVSRCGLHKRSLQRLFERYVGVSPKNVIQRYRLHEAAERMEHGEVAEWVDLSLELGYYDHSHFIRDFKAIVGLSPEEYVRKSV
ncbi:helix-turn-helix transcriptional regulator [Paenibacillus sp. GD4]|uniref:helix-turn-helix domain-containing protein n=1 Tax=Paenibacillus sp. GD4 TaxID=3068890 RepID=UPI0027968456|nr:helix-turn-helix transcriptional regulator [Paenibacillus sp. GD4]MDQ1910737.1 helix-turn-helix transcriptional regulator [Paenibacillus sp. GD4]